MRLDRNFERESKKTFNGDCSREYKAQMISLASIAAREMSSTAIARTFDTYLKRYGRSIIALCVAATVIDRADRLSPVTVDWAHNVMHLWTNRGPTSTARLIIRDGLHPTKIESYAGNLIKYTMEDRQ